MVQIPPLIQSRQTCLAAWRVERRSLETIKVYRQGSMAPLAAGGALAIVFFASLLLAPWIAGSNINELIFAGLVTLGVAGLGYLADYMIGGLLVKRPIVLIGPEGLTVRALRIGAIPWGAINRVRVRETPSHIASSTPTIEPKMLEIWTDDNESFLRRMPPIRRLYARSDIKLGAALIRIYPDSLTMKAADMISIFQKHAPEADYEGLEVLEPK